jgi:hypothetical protein
MRRRSGIAEIPEAHHRVDGKARTRACALPRCSTQSASASRWTLLDYRHVQRPRRLHVGLTLKLDVLIAFTALVFVTAIVLGAF